MTPKPKPGTWGALPSTTNGLGIHFSSPRKKKNPQKTQTFVYFPGQALRHQCLLDHLDDLFNHKTACEPPGCEAGLDTAPESFTLEMETIGNMDVEETDDNERSEHPPPLQWARQDHLFSNWKSLIPTIVCPHLEYLSETLGKPLTGHASLLSACSRDCDKRPTKITCLYFDCKFLLCLCVLVWYSMSFSIFVYHSLALSMCHTSPVTHL